MKKASSCCKEETFRFLILLFNTSGEKPESNPPKPPFRFLVCFDRFRQKEIQVGSLGNLNQASSLWWFKRQINHTSVHETPLVDTYPEKVVRVKELLWIVSIQLLHFKPLREIFLGKTSHLHIFCKLFDQTSSIYIVISYYTVSIQQAMFAITHVESDERSVFLPTR